MAPKKRKKSPSELSRLCKCKCKMPLAHPRGSAGRLGGWAAVAARQTSLFSFVPGGQAPWSVRCVRASTLRRRRSRGRGQRDARIRRKHWYGACTTACCAAPPFCCVLLPLPLRSHWRVGDLVPPRLASPSGRRSAKRGNFATTWRNVQAQRPGATSRPFVRAEDAPLLITHRQYSSAQNPSSASGHLCAPRPRQPRAMRSVVGPAVWT